MTPQPTRYRFLPQLCAGLLLATALLVPSAGASHDTRDCDVAEKNVQCNALGSISMDSQTEIRGTPITIEIDVTIGDTHSSQGARYLMFSVRHDGSSSPVSLSLEKFETRRGAIFTERVDHDIPNEINIWVHVADVPEGEPIQLIVKAGSTDKGAFRLETLVMPFDRGYEALRDADGKEITLFSFTMLGVNKASDKVSSGSGSSLADKVRVPGPSVAVALAMVAAAAFAARRGRQ